MLSLQAPLTNGCEVSANDSQPTKMLCFLLSSTSAPAPFPEQQGIAAVNGTANAGEQIEMCKGPTSQRANTRTSNIAFYLIARGVEPHLQLFWIHLLLPPNWLSYEGS